MLVAEDRRETPDSRLVEMVRAGDRVAFDLLVKRFQKPVHAVAFAVLSDREAALDVLQESFIAAYRQIGGLGDPAKFGPWVCAIARNQAKRLYRDRVRAFSREVPLPDVYSSPIGLQTVDWKTARIREALSVLTDVQAETLSMFYMEGYSIRDCAYALGVPEGTIKRRLHDARRRLKKEMVDMVKEHLKEFALPEDYRVVIGKSTPIHTTRPALVYFRDRWVLLWQDGVPWEPYDGPFWFWLSESGDGKTWSEPRKLDLPRGSDEMRMHPDYLQLMNATAVGGRLYFLTQQFAGHMDLYSSEDLVNWTTHPRFRWGVTGRGSLFSSENDLYVMYPSLVRMANLGNRVDVIRSSDGGFSWTWLNSPMWEGSDVYDAAGAVVGDRIFVAWREILARWIVTPGDPLPSRELVNVHWDQESPEGTVSQRVRLTWSDDGGQTWAFRVWEPQEYPDDSGLTIKGMFPERPEAPVVEALDIAKPCYSNSLRIASFDGIMAIAQEVRRGDAAEEVWLAFSRDGGKTWPEKAVYSPGELGEPAIAFAPDGTLMLAGSSRTGDQARPWVVRSTIATPR